MRRLVDQYSNSSGVAGFPSVSGLLGSHMTEKLPCTTSVPQALTHSQVKCEKSQNVSEAFFLLIFRNFSQKKRAHLFAISNKALSFMLSTKYISLTSEYVVSFNKQFIKN